MKLCKLILAAAVGMGSIAAGAAFAADTFNVHVDTTTKTYSVPIHFSGVAFEMGTLIKGKYSSGYMFDPTNSQMLTLFTNIGLMNLRMGGGSVDSYDPEMGYNSDGYTGVDKLFDFAKSAGMNVIYSLRQYATNSTGLGTYESEGAGIASHITSRNPSQLDYFCIGNEANINFDQSVQDPYASVYKSSGSDSYVDNWKTFAASVVASVPGATFGGPDTADLHNSTYSFWNGKSWTENFIDDRASGYITVPITDATQHYYVGGDSATTGQQAVDGMLSASWDTGTNQWLYDNILSGVLSAGWGYRMTESDDYSPGMTNASDCFAAALWALDYMHWMAAHGCHGVNFENKIGNPNCLIYIDSSKRFQTTPKGLGILAFNLAAPGDTVETVTSIDNPQSVDATAYAEGDASNLYITIVNKTHGSGGGTTLNVTNYPSGFTASHAAYMLMSPGSGGGAAHTGTLGGVSITNNAVWNGAWTSIPVTSSGQCNLSVPGCSAAVVHIY